MKRLAIFSFAILLAFFMTACSNDSNGNDNPNASQPNLEENQNSEVTDNENTSSNNATSDKEEMKSKMDELEFSEIDVEVSYGKNQEYEAAIEQDKNRPIEAEVEDELNDVYLQGKEAFDDIYSKAKTLNLSSAASDEEVIDQVLKAFDLKSDYEKFEVEIKFNDGTELEVTDKKQ